MLAIDQFMYANAYVLAIPNADMYALATQTASYREKGTAPKDMLDQITRVVEDSMVPFSALRNTQSRFYDLCKTVRKEIRSSALNADGAITQQAKLRQGL